jgi:hypothetical protein
MAPIIVLVPDLVEEVDLGLGEEERGGEGVDGGVAPALRAGISCLSIDDTSRRRKRRGFVNHTSRQSLIIREERKMRVERLRAEIHRRIINEEDCEE